MKKYSSEKMIALMVTILVILLNASCKKLIEIPVNPKNAIGQDQVFADSADVMGAMAGLYTSFAASSPDYSTTFHNGLITLTAGLSADELSATDQFSTFAQFQGNAVLPNNTDLSTMWTSSYAALYLANTCLTGVQNSKGISAGLKQQLVGEIEVVRALYYFNMVNLFGGVPLVTSSDYKINSVLPRASQDSVYARIITDLNDARLKLKPGYPSASRARPNLYTASALLAKVYLFRKQWQKAFDLAGQVIGSGLYPLETDLDNVFLNGSHEAIWQLPANGFNSQTQEASLFIPFDNSSVPPYVLTDTLIHAFETGDDRKAKWVGISVADVDGVKTVYNYPFKYQALSPSDPRKEDYMVLRAADIYLVRAEAAANLGNMSGSLTDLNIIRTRAGLDSSMPSTTAGLLAAIAHERQVELFCEWGNRWYDLKRSGNLDRVLGIEKPGWQSYSALFPIPLSQLQLNPALIQNPGYK